VTNGDTQKDDRYDYFENNTQYRTRDVGTKAMTPYSPLMV